ncbi:MAG: HDOD domain-containing protein [bacterium]|nr:HDOD domain-containing protein [bacterium]
MSEHVDLLFIDEIKELAAMPKTSTDLMAMLQNPAASLKDIAGKIELDPALALFILRMSNSAFYGIKQELRSIQIAVQMLGLPEIKSILMSYFLRNLYSATGTNHVLEYLWEHSISVAVFAKELSSHLEIEQEGAYLAGLFHDIGKLVINLHDPEAYEKIIKKVDEKGEKFMILEEEVFGYSHIQTGYYLVNKWGLAGFIKNAILFHHYFISYAGDNPIVGIVAFANQLVHKYIERKPILIDIYLREYNLTFEEVDGFAEKTIGVAAQYHSMLALDHSHKEESRQEVNKPQEPVLEKSRSYTGISPTPPTPEKIPSPENKDTVQPTVQPTAKIKTKEPGYHPDPSFGKPTIDLEEKKITVTTGKRPSLSKSQREFIANISKDTLSDGVQLFLQLEKIKKELFELKKIYYLFDYVPLQVLRNHGEILKLFGQSVNTLLKDPKMSAILKLSKVAKTDAPKEFADK